MTPEETFKLQKYSGYASKLRSRFADCIGIRLELFDGTFRELTSPILGRDFVSGELEDGKTIGHFRKSFLRSIELISVAEATSHTLRCTRKSVGELMSEGLLPKTIRYRFRDFDSVTYSCRALDLGRGFIFTDSYKHPVITISALSVIEISCE